MAFFTSVAQVPFSKPHLRHRPGGSIEQVLRVVRCQAVQVVVTIDRIEAQQPPIQQWLPFVLDCCQSLFKGLQGEGIVAVSPDPGRAKMARRFGQMLDGDLAILNKTRPEHDRASVTEVIGDVRDKVAIMSDDMIVTGGTLIAGAEALLGAGALEVYACATHGLFPGDAFEKLATSKITQVTVTNTVPVDPIKRPEKIDVLPVTTLLAETIMNVFADDSVSAIFAGENQLF